MNFLFYFYKLRIILYTLIYFVELINYLIYLLQFKLYENVALIIYNSTQ